MKKKSTVPAPDPASIYAQQQAGQTSELGSANSTIDQAKTGVSPYLAGSSGMSEFRRALTGKMSHATANVGDNALAHARERAQMAGFGGGGQPITYGSENELGQEQANRIAAIPGQVEAQVAPLEMQAASQFGNLAGEQLSAAHVYDPQTYFSEYEKQQEEARKRKAGIWGSLAKIGLTAGGAAIGSLGGPGGTLAGAKLGSSILR